MTPALTLDKVGSRLLNLLQGTIWLRILVAHVVDVNTGGMFVCWAIVG